MRWLCSPRGRARKSSRRRARLAGGSGGGLVMVKRRKKGKRRRAAPRVQAERVCSAALASILCGRPQLSCTLGDAVKRLWDHAKANG